MDERPNLAEEALALLKRLRQDLSPLQVTMVLAAAQEIHTVDNAQCASMKQIIRGDHIGQDPEERGSYYRFLQ